MTHELLNGVAAQDSTLMQDHTAPTPSPATRACRRPVINQTGMVVSVALAVAGLLTIIFQYSIRTLEAWGAGEISLALFATNVLHITNSGDPAVGFTVGGDWMIARITLGCSIAIAMAVVLFAAAGLAWFARFSIKRILLITGVSLVALIVVNQSRLVGMMFAWGAGNEASYELLHGPLGVAITALIVLVTLYAFFATTIKPVFMPGKRQK